jgi:hypothetical protein
LTNRETYQVSAVRDDGGLDVVNTRTGRVLVMPADYLAADAALAYASTAHAAQGATVDAGHLLLTNQLDRAAAYVGMTRGRDANTVWAVTDTGIPDTPTTTGRGLLANAIDHDLDVDPDAAAVDQADTDTLRRASAQTLLALVENESRLACRIRLDADLDTLQDEGVLSVEDRARFGADQGSEHLARLLRSYEQAGHDPLDLLRGAVQRRSLTGTVSVAQTLSYRLHPDGLLPAPAASEGPGRIPADRSAYLSQLSGLLAERRADLAAQAADDHPEWATSVLGPVPDDDAENAEARAEWTERAGIIAAYREATDWDHPTLAIGRCPGVHTPEKRAAWHHAYTAAGMPEERRPEAEMTTGRLLVRAHAADRARVHAPESVHDAQRQAHRGADDARRAAVLARAHGRLEDAARHEDDAARHAHLAEHLDTQAEARGAHLAYYAETFRAGQAADDELRRRGIVPGTEPDRTTAEQWFAADHQARQADDEHRTVTENDLALGDGDVRDEASGPDTARSVPGHDSGQEAAGSLPSPRAQALEVEATAAADAALDELADHVSEDAATADQAWADDVGPDYVPAPDTSAQLARDAATLHDTTAGDEAGISG